MSDHKSVADTRYFKIQIPSEVFLARLFISPYPLFAKFADYPFRYVISKTAGIDEIVLWFSHVEDRAFESDNRSNA